MAEKQEPKVESKTAPRRLRKPVDLRGRDKKAKLDARGREIVSNEQLEKALNFTREVSVAERVREAVRGEALRQEALAMGMETFEEADDFVIGDDYDPTSPYEEIFEGNVVDDLRARGELIQAKEKEELEKAKDQTKERILDALSGLAKEDLETLLAKVNARDKKQKAAEGER